MTDADVDQFVRRAEQIYATRLRTVLEPEHIDEFVAIEPESGDHFFGKTLSEHQTIQNMLAACAVDLYAGRLMALDCATKMDRGLEIRSEAALRIGQPRG